MPSPPLWAVWKGVGAKPLGVRSTRPKGTTTTQKAREEGWAEHFGNARWWAFDRKNTCQMVCLGPSPQAPVLPTPIFSTRLVLAWEGASSCAVPTFTACALSSDSTRLLPAITVAIWWASNDHSQKWQLFKKKKKQWHRMMLLGGEGWGAGRVWIGLPFHGKVGLGVPCRGDGSFQ